MDQSRSIQAVRDEHDSYLRSRGIEFARTIRLLKDDVGKKMYQLVYNIYRAGQLVARQYYNSSLSIGAIGQVIADNQSGKVPFGYIGYPGLFNSNKSSIEELVFG